MDDDLIKRDFDLSANNFLALPSRAEYFCAALTQEMLMQALLFAREQGVAIKIIASGSNVVLPEKISGLVISPGMQGIVKRGDRLQVSAGVLWDDLVKESIERFGLAGLENLSGIPGTVGAAPIHNIGAYGVELSDCFGGLVAINLKTHERHQFDAAACQFSYRNSVFKHPAPAQYIITEVEIALPQIQAFKPCLDYADLRNAVAGGQDSHSPQAIREAVLQLRYSKLPDPVMQPNVGSFFKNPVINLSAYNSLIKKIGPVPNHIEGSFRKLSAAWLIDQLGLKGFRVGGAQVSNQHALVIENAGWASFDDILALTRKVQQAVMEKFYISLQPEPVFFNGDPIS
ncbi:MAG: UDP-N-acetylmuramate dehydrogenase [Gammaproteobacteria bacterium]|nr:UDP-N-acetylmuramate dehydrogenase [Gammaproteobacteria bacterium]